LNLTEDELLRNVLPVWKGPHLVADGSTILVESARIDQEVEHLIAERQEAARQVLSAARVKLDALAAALLTDETVGENALVRILGPRPAPVDMPFLT
jgi:peptidase M41-like protein